MDILGKDGGGISAGKVDIILKTEKMSTVVLY